MANEYSKILSINAHLKQIEFLLHVFDNEKDVLTLGEIRNMFKEKFKHKDILLNQYFGIIRLIPLLLIKEVYKNEKKELKGDIEKIKIIRDALSHNSFFINHEGYSFSNDRDKVTMSFEEFQKFLHRIENEFYAARKVS